MEDTEEEVIDFFVRKPENGRKAFHKKFRPNRNWCYFEQCSDIVSSLVTVVQTPCLHCRPSNSHQTIETDQQQIGTNELKVRFWLESANKHQDGRKFVSYDLFIPNIK